MVTHVNRKSASISASGSSSSAAYPVKATDLHVYNAGVVPVFLASGGAGVAATVGGNFVPAGEYRKFERSAEDTHLAAITASGTAVVYFN